MGGVMHRSQSSASRRRFGKMARRNRILHLEHLEDRRLLAQTVGLLMSDFDPSRGYTLFAPSTSTTTYLIDQDGKAVNSWFSQYQPMPSYLVGSSLAGPGGTDETGLYEPGDMLRSGQVNWALDANGQLVDGDPTQPGVQRVPLLKQMAAPGGSGIVELYNWEGDLKWQFALNEVASVNAGYTGTPDRRLHHDIELMPNGHILMIAWERFSQEQAVAHGRNPGLLQAADRSELWPDMVIEVDPSLNRPVDVDGDGETDLLISGKNAIVWQWHLWDHVVQDDYPNKPNYGSIAAHPHKADLNYVPVDEGSGGQLADWTHFNGIDYNPHLDQIVVSSREFSEFWVIDHSTTTAEAAGSTGGRSGMGGDIIYRWGSPHVYGRGTLADQQMRFQHDPTWIDRGRPGEQNFLIFDNGWNRAGAESWSQVLEIDAPDDQQWVLNNDIDGTADDLIVFGTKALNYLEDFANLPAPWSSSWMPLTGNWDALGGDSGGFYDPENNVFLLTNQTAADTAWSDLVVLDGPVGADAAWLPISGDWDDNGTDDAGLYDPAVKTFYQRAADGTWSSFSVPGAAAGLLPVAGDWDGLGADTVGLYQPLTGHWWFSNAVGAWSTDIDLPAPGPVGPNWRPIAGNWDGLEGDTVGLYDPATNNWYLNNRLDGSLTQLVTILAPVGVPAKWLPVAGDWNNNGADSVGLYDPSFYTLMPGQPFTPYSASWTYASTPRSDFFGRIISGSQRLPNGNTLINEGTEGRFFEVTPQKNIVWEYKNPLSLQVGAPPGILDFNEPVPALAFDGIPGVYGNMVFRAYRYEADFTPQFLDGGLTGDAPIELYPNYFDTPALYDPATNNWYLNNHSDGTISDLILFNTGTKDPATWIPVAGDWNGDGLDSVGLYNAADRQFYLNNNVDGTTTGFITIQVPMALVSATWKHVTGDWDGDGIDEVGVYDPVSNNWWLNTGDAAWSAPIFVPAPADVPASWIPITGDWNGDGVDSMGLYDPSTNNWYLNNKNDGTWTDDGVSGITVLAPVRVPSTWVPLTGDWNGNGRDTVGLYDPSTGDWFLNNKIDGTIANMYTVPGRREPATWLPITGDWDGTGAVAPAALLAAGEITAASLPAARNPYNPLDANGDGTSSALDVLSVVNAINVIGDGPLNGPLPGSEGRGLYADVNGDNLLSPVDVLKLINHLNAQVAAPVPQAASGSSQWLAYGYVKNVELETPAPEAPQSSDMPPLAAASASPLWPSLNQNTPPSATAAIAAAEGEAWNDDLLEEILDEVAETVADAWGQAG